MYIYIYKYNYYRLFKNWGYECPSNTEKRSLFPSREAVEVKGLGFESEGRGLGFRVRVPKP